MNFRFFLYFFFVTVSLFGQGYTLKCIPFRDEFNTHLIASAPFVDKDGFIWYKINNSHTFYKYDGRNKIRYSFNSKIKGGVVLHDVVYKWIQDNNGKIWAISINGAFVITPKTLKVDYLHWSDPQLIDNYKDLSQISSIKDTKGNIWISIGAHYVLKFDKNYKLITYTNKRLQEKYQSFKKTVLKVDTLKIRLTLNKDKGFIRVVKELKDGRILLQSYNELFVIDKDGMHSMNNNILFNIKNQDLKIQCITNGEVFKKNTSGIYYYKNNQYRYNYIKDLDIQIITFPFDNIECNNSKIFSVYSNKVFIFKITGQKLTSIDSINVKQNIFKGIDVIKNDIVTFSSCDNIYILKKNTVKFKKHLNSEDQKISTRNILSDVYGNLYVGTYSGLYKINGNNGRSIKLYNNEFIIQFYSAIFLKNNFKVWVSDQNTFIKLFDLKTNKISNLKYSSKGDFKIKDIKFIKRKSNDSLWIGTNEQGLYVFDTKNLKLSSYENTNILLKKKAINDILRTKDGKVWIATNKGLFVKESKGKLINYVKHNKFFINEDITVFCEDVFKNIWIGTANKGVAVLNQNTASFKVYNYSNGLSNNIVCGILESSRGMWFSTYYGLSFFNRKTKRFSNFYEHDGISDNEFNRRSFCKKNDTTFCFGGLNGITEFNPNDFNYNDKRCKIFLSKCQYFSKEQNKVVIDFLENSNEVVLPYDKNSYVAQFTINDVFDKARKYFYKIDGLTNGWIDIGAGGNVNLYNLPSGRHVLTVKALDSKGIESENGVKIPIYVEQIFYKTPFFIVFTFLCFLMIVGLLFTNRMRKQRVKYETEREIIVLKENALKAQMNPHFVFNILNNIQSVMFLKGELEANKYLGAFSRFLRLTLDMSKQELVRLKDEMDYINYYLMLNNLQMDDELHFLIDTDLAAEDQEILFVPVMFVQPFIENAIIHGLSGKKEDKKIQIECFKEDNYLVFHIEDNGIGRAASAILSNKRKFRYKSWSTLIVNERIEIFNSTEKDKVVLKIIDLIEEGKSVGTKVILKFKIV